VHVALGVAQGFGASVRGPGIIAFANMRLMRFGETEDGNSPAMDALAQIWREAGFEAQAFANLGQLIWEKFICNVSLSAPSLVFGQSVGGLLSVPEQWRIALACGLEAHAVGQALGVPFSFDDPEAYITDFARSVAGAKPSMLQDFEAGRRSEIDVINGRVPVEAEKAGMDAPWNRMLADIVRAKEAGFP
jgi:2-dehydropantoate 2-reductase